MQSKGEFGVAGQLLTSAQMAEFAARGVLKMEAVVPDAINRQFLDDVGHVDESEIEGVAEHYGRIQRSSAIPVVKAGTPLSAAYPTGSALSRLMALPRVAGAVVSLVGSHCVLDHHFLHVTFPPRFFKEAGRRHASQHTHQDSTIDPRQAFDMQIMYFPHEVTREMGGTRYLPGSHLRVVSESAIARYQNVSGQQHVVCPAGTLLFTHMGIWHGGGLNQSDRLRYMFKIRLCPTQRQCRLWDHSDLGADHFEQRPIFWRASVSDIDPIHQQLTRGEPWFEGDTGRIEFINRIRFWRYLLGDESFDADYWVTRVENEFA